MTEAANPESRNRKGARPIAAATLQIGGANRKRGAEPGARQVTFTMQLEAGKTRLRTQFLDKEGRVLCSANYVRVRRLEPGAAGEDHS